MVAQNATRPPFMRLSPAAETEAHFEALLRVARRNGLNVRIVPDADLESPAIWQAGSLPFLRRDPPRRYVTGECEYLAVLHPGGRPRAQAPDAVPAGQRDHGLGRSAPRGEHALRGRRPARLRAGHGGLMG
jgi:hypothetical protein